MLKNKYFLVISIYIISLMLVSMACNAASIPNPFATETPTPTLTFTPSPTSTPTLIPTATATNSPTPMPTGVTTEALENGVTRFIDYDNKYQLELPENWLVIPISKEKFSVLAEQIAKENPNMADALEAFKNNLDPKMFRGIALYSDEKFLYKSYATNMSITVFEDDTLTSMPLAFISAVLEDSFTNAGSKILTSGVNEIDNKHQVEVEYIDYEQRLTVNGSEIVIHSRALLFMTKNKLVMVQVATPNQFSDEIFLMTESIGETIEAIK